MLDAYDSLFGICYAETVAVPSLHYLRS